MENQVFWQRQSQLSQHSEKLPNISGYVTVQSLYRSKHVFTCLHPINLSTGS